MRSNEEEHRSRTRRHVALLLAVVCLPAAAASVVTSLARDRTESSVAVEEEKPNGPAGRSADGERPWALFRGDARLSGYRSTRVSDQPSLLWSFDTASMVESTAAIAAGAVYVGTADGDLLRLDLNPGREEGRLRWKYAAGAGIRSSPAVEGGRVYVGDDAGYVHAVDKETGAKVWVFETEGGAEIISSPNVDEDRLLIGSYDAHLYCLSPADGTLRWKYLTGGPVHSTPAVTEGQTFVAGCDEVLRAIGVTTGKQIREAPLGGYSASSPAISASRLYLGTFANEVVAVEWKDLSRAWTYRNEKRQFPFQSCPAVGRGVVVIGGQDKIVHAIDAKTGTRRWTFATGARVDSSPVIVHDRVICGSSDKNLYMLDLEDGAKIWSFAADEAFLASPAVAEERLVIGSESGMVYCFDVSRRPARGASGTASRGADDTGTNER